MQPPSFIGFPRVISAIAHTFPSALIGENEGDYVNHKSFHSRNVQVIQVKIADLGSLGNVLLFRKAQLI